ncbi:hypothetical protein MC7420_7844 [Coleofasciculus chthonoplastes PCC 7420]|uniref:Uncharacterized protein n=1 Tax=Coleofasciculus chthonoplastes PCC 7420 TaxID=118168 RepID=B4VJG6_9CYAN|nr:hypothetical protein [Coleofasciculus chthonoplastes]EDX78106.1 hypothetical protein MC7420_7844 [Coleofasciculus chthonoplastes PCC 7420]
MKIWIDAQLPPTLYFLDNHDIPRHLSRWIECSLCTNPKAIGHI